MTKKSKVPVLILLFNRTETLPSLIQSLSSYKPDKIFISIDGPRNEEDKVAISTNTAFLKNAITWESEICFRYAEKNYGRRYSQVAGISWFFDQNTHGIILEDDIVPHSTFYQFCEKLLDIYKKNKNILLISGQSPYKYASHLENNEFYFSNFSHIWGFATWKRSWDLYQDDIDIDLFNAILDKKKYFESSTKKYLKSIYRRISSGHMTHGWDYIFNYSSFKNDMVSIIPSHNLVNNSGFGDSSLNCKNKYSIFNNKSSHAVDLDKVVYREPIVNVEIDRIVGKILFNRYRHLFQIYYKELSFSNFVRGVIHHFRK